jgi:O-antigen/teichoic acid export membrane protein
MAQSILTNTTIATIGRLINILLGIVVTALITRLLGPSQFGSYVLLLSIGALVQLAADFGLYLTLSRTVAEQPHQSPVLLSQIFSLRLLLLVTVFLLATFITLIVPSLRPYALPFIIMSFGLSCQSFSQLLMGIYQHRQVVWRATLGDLVGRLAQIASIFLFSTSAASVSSMIIAFTIGTALAFLLHHWLLPVAPWRLVFAWSAWKKIIVVSWPLGAMLLVNAVYFRIDMLILSFFRPAWEIGWYGAAYRIIESALFFPAMFGGLLLPRIAAALSRQDLPHVNQYLIEGLRVLLVLSIYSLLVLLYFSQPILLLIAGPTFIAAAPLLQILSLALVIMFFGNLFGFALVALGRQSFLLRLYLGLAVFNTCANLLLIPHYGAVAAAWTTVATELIAAGSAAFYVHLTTGFSLPYSLVFKILFTFIGCSVFMYLLPSTIPIAVRAILLTGVYGVVVFSANIVSPTHFRLLRAGTTDPVPPPLG